MECVDCPKDYKPPPPCEYHDFDDAEYERYDDQDFKQEYESIHRWRGGALRR